MYGTSTQYTGYGSFAPLAQSDPATADEETERFRSQVQHAFRHASAIPDFDIDTHSLVSRQQSVRGGYHQVPNNNNNNNNNHHHNSHVADAHDVAELAGSHIEYYAPGHPTRERASSSLSGTSSSDKYATAVSTTTKVISVSAAVREKGGRQDIIDPARHQIDEAPREYRPFALRRAFLMIVFGGLVALLVLAIVALQVFPDGTQGYAPFDSIQNLTRRGLRGRGGVGVGLEQWNGGVVGRGLDVGSQALGRRQDGGGEGDGTTSTVNSVEVSIAPVLTETTAVGNTPEEGSTTASETSTTQVSPPEEPSPSDQTTEDTTPPSTTTTRNEETTTSTTTSAVGVPDTTSLTTTSSVDPGPSTTTSMTTSTTLFTQPGGDPGDGNNDETTRTTMSPPSTTARTHHDDPTTTAVTEPENDPAPPPSTSSTTTTSTTKGNPWLPHPPPVTTTTTKQNEGPTRICTAFVTEVVTSWLGKRVAAPATALVSNVMVRQEDGCAFTTTITRVITTYIPRPPDTPPTTTKTDVDTTTTKNGDQDGSSTDKTTTTSRPEQTTTTKEPPHQPPPTPPTTSSGFDHTSTTTTFKWPPFPPPPPQPDTSTTKTTKTPPSDSPPSPTKDPPTHQWPPKPPVTPTTRSPTFTPTTPGTTTTHVTVPGDNTKTTKTTKVTITDNDPGDHTTTTPTTSRKSTDSHAPPPNSDTPRPGPPDNGTPHPGPPNQDDPTNTKSTRTTTRTQVQPPNTPPVAGNPDTTHADNSKPADPTTTKAAAPNPGTTSPPTPTETNNQPPKPPKPPHPTPEDNDNDSKPPLTKIELSTPDVILTTMLPVPVTTRHTTVDTTIVRTSTKSQGGVTTATITTQTDFYIVNYAKSTQSVIVGDATNSPGVLAPYVYTETVSGVGTRTRTRTMYLDYVTNTYFDSDGEPMATSTFPMLKFIYTTVYKDGYGRPYSTETYRYETTTSTLRDSNGRIIGTETLQVTMTPSLTTLVDAKGRATKTETVMVPRTTSTTTQIVTSPTPASNATGASNKATGLTGDAQVGPWLYLTGLLLPTLLTIALLVPIRAFNQTARQYQPFHALTSAYGATTAESLCLQTTSVWALPTALRSLARGHALLALTGVLTLCSGLLIALSPEVLRVALHGPECRLRDGDGADYGICALGVVVFPAPARAAVALLVLMLVLVAIAALVLRPRCWRTGVKRPPWNLFSMGHLTGYDDFRSLLGRMRPRGGGGGDGVAIRNEDAIRAFGDRRFGFAYFRRGAGGRVRYGVRVVNDAGSFSLLAKGARDGRRGGAGVIGFQRLDPWRVRRKAMPFFALSFVGRMLFILFLSAVIVTVLIYDTEDSNEGFWTFMAGDTFGVRFFFAGVGVLISFCWGYYFNCIAILSPYKLLSQNNSMKEAIYLNPPTNPFSGLSTALSRRHPDLYLALVSLTAVVANALPALLANVPDKFFQHHAGGGHLVCAWLAIAVLGAMQLVVAASFLVAWPHMPMDPSTIAGAMYYALDPSTFLHRGVGVGGSEDGGVSTV